MKPLFVLLLFTTQLTLAQSVFTGQVTDGKGNPVRGVNVTLSKPNTGNILAFSITGADGKYKIETGLTTDSLQLNLYALGFAPQKRVIINNSQTTNFIVSEQNINLKEVVVKPDPIKRRGDTLTFNVGEFKDKNDRAIVDIIRKLPGIEVEPSGRIMYQGKPINKYYIEGLDLLGGRYNLANENLPADAVSSVQIVENHQPIKMLDSLEFSENAAINIQLKNKVTTTGTANLGAGFSPLLWEANITPMLFTKKNQFIGSYQSNNVGNNLSKQTKVLTINDIMSGFDSDDRKSDAVSIVTLPSPPFSDSRWLNNNAHLGSVNQLRKFKNDYELRLNASYTNDYQQQNGSTSTLFFTPTDTIGIIENKYNQLFFNSLEATLNLQKNDKKTFFKDELKFKGFWDSQRGNLVRNGENLTQNLSNPFFSLSNSLRDILKVGKQLLTLTSFVNVSRTPQSLGVSPGQFSRLLNGGIAYNYIQQNVNAELFQTENAVAFTRSVKGVVLSPTIGFQIQRQQLNSELTKTQEEQSNQLTGIFANNLRWLKMNYYAKLKSEYRIKDWRFTTQLPLSLYRFDLRDDELNSGQNVTRLAFEPNVSANYEFNAFWKANLSLRRQLNLGDRDDVHYGYILRNYRTIERRNAPLPVNISRSVAGSINFRNPLSATFANLLMLYSVTENNLLFANRIDQNGANELVVREQANNSENLTMNARIGKYFSKTKTNISTGVNVSQSQRQQIINDKLALVTYQNVIPTAKITTRFAAWFDAEYEYQLAYLKNTVEGQNPQAATQQKHLLSVSLYPVEKLYLGLQNEWYINRFANQNSTNLFTDIIARYTLTKRKIDLELNWTNIFNLKTLTTVSASSFAYSESTYELRPSQVLGKVRFSFK